MKLQVHLIEEIVQSFIGIQITTLEICLMYSFFAKIFQFKILFKQRYDSVFK